MTTLRARFDGKVLIPESPVNLPTDRVLEIHVEGAEDGKAALQKLLEVAEKFPSNPDAPIDGAEQHDHYLYGTSKRQDP